jgi:hypothetical protein
MLSGSQEDRQAMSTVSSAAPPTATPTELRALRRTLTAANDAKVRQVVAMMEEIGDRGAADALIAPLRERLAQLRPARKLRFERLLFIPMDPLIVPPQAWQPNGPMIPRTAVAPIAGTVRIALGREARAIDAAIAGKNTLNLDLVLQIGAMLWPIASRILSMAPMPIDWTEAGLKPATYQPIAAIITAVLSRLPTLQTLFPEATTGVPAPREEAIEAIVASLTGETREIQMAVIALLLARLPHAAPLLQHIETAARKLPDGVALRLASDQAADVLLDRMEAEGGTEAQVAGMNLAEAGAEIGRLSAFLLELEKRTITAERRTRLKALRQRLDASCRKRFASALTDELLVPLQVTAEAVDRPTQLQLEMTARHLRAMETTARKMGGAPIYDDLLNRAASTIQSIGSNVLSCVRAARLVELLAGPDVAMALLLRQP